MEDEALPVVSRCGGGEDILDIGQNEPASVQ